MRRLLLPSLLLFLSACPPPPPDDLPPPRPPPYAPSDRDAPDTPLGLACLRLRALGCPEGFPNRAGRTCFEVLSLASAVASVPDACVRASATVEDVRACGAENGVRVRCFFREPRR